MSAPSPRETRRRFGISRFLVPHPDSFWFARTILAGVLGTAAVFGSISWLHQRRLLEELLANGALKNPALLDHYAQTSLWNSAGVILCASIFVTLVACFLLHRIAGPIYRIHQHMLRVLEDEEVGELRLRTDDRLQDVCQTYNQLLYKLELIDPKRED